MRIGELAQRADIAPHTIRFYERENLLDDRFFERDANGYRNYREEAVERLKMIKQGQAAGYTLAEVRQLMRAWDVGALTDELQATYIAEKINEITARMAELEQIRSYLTDKLARLRAGADVVEMAQVE